MSAVQLAFFPFRKPLLDLLGPEFFEGIPRAPGVYLFLSETGKVLYVGQSKDLRSRLRFYKNARPDREPRRILRMINRARSLQFELCSDPEEARERELRLIQRHRPTYNRAHNGNPLHSFLLLDQAENSLLLAMSDSPERSSPQLFGAFKGTGRCRRFLHGVARLFWHAAHPDAGLWDIPLQLHEQSRGNEAAIHPLSAALDRSSALIHDYLSGFRDGLTELFAPRISEIRDPHLKCILQNDLLLLSEFFTAGPQMNRRLSERHGIPPLIDRETLAKLPRLP